MDDLALGLWVAERARESGVAFLEHSHVSELRSDGSPIVDGYERAHQRTINATGPWAGQLLERSGISSPYAIDPVRGVTYCFQIIPHTHISSRSPGNGGLRSFCHGKVGHWLVPRRSVKL